MTDQLYLHLQMKINHEQSQALLSIKTEAAKASSLPELRETIYQVTRVLNNSIIALCDTAATEREELQRRAKNAGQLAEQAKELLETFPTYAILKAGHGQEEGRIVLEDSDPMDCDHFAAKFSEMFGITLEGALPGEDIPDGCEDYSVTITDDPDSVRCWSSQNYMVAAE
jgi:hypothetical protein